MNGATRVCHDSCVMRQSEAKIKGDYCALAVMLTSSPNSGERKDKWKFVKVEIQSY